MARYVDVEKLIAEYDRVHIGAAGGARKLMEEAPTADVQEVKHGEWIHKNGEMYCSVCGGEALMDEVYYQSPYCPECGAKMDLKEGA